MKNELFNTLPHGVFKNLGVKGVMYKVTINKIENSVVVDKKPFTIIMEDKWRFVLMGEDFSVMTIIGNSRSASFLEPSIMNHSSRYSPKDSRGLIWEIELFSIMSEEESMEMIKKDLEKIKSSQIPEGMLDPERVKELFGKCSS